MQVKLISSTHAREVNPYGESPEKGWWPNDGTHGTLEMYRRKWQEAESKLQTYPLSEKSIEYLESLGECKALYDGSDYCWCKDNCSGIEIGKIYNAELVNGEIEIKI